MPYQHVNWPRIQGKSFQLKARHRRKCSTHFGSEKLLPAVARSRRGTAKQNVSKTFMMAARRPLEASQAIYTRQRRSEGTSERGWSYVYVEGAGVRTGRPVALRMTAADGLF